MGVFARGGMKPCVFESYPFMFTLQSRICYIIVPDGAFVNTFFFINLNRAIFYCRKGEFSRNAELSVYKALTGGPVERLL